LEITLTSPSGTTSTLAYNGETSGTYANWRFGIVQMLDEKSSGEWKLTVIDKVGTNNGILKKFSLKIYGR
jgi:subtilisin-like proprotein convertase family protein